MYSILNLYNLYSNFKYKVFNLLNIQQKAK